MMKNDLHMTDLVMLRLKEVLGVKDQDQVLQDFLHQTFQIFLKIFLAISLEVEIQKEGKAEGLT